MKRLISLLLTVAMVLGILCSAPFAVSATEGEAYTFYFVDSQNWGTVYAYAATYAYEDDGTRSLVQDETKQMVKEDTMSTDELSVYSVVFDTQYGCVFFDNGSEDPDLYYSSSEYTFTDANNQYIYIDSYGNDGCYSTLEEALNSESSSEGDGSGDDGGFESGPVEDGEGYNVYFIASNGWTDVTAYAYSIDEESGDILEEETVTGEKLDRTAPDGSTIFGMNISIYFTDITFSITEGDEIACAIDLNATFNNRAYYESKSNLWYDTLSNTDLDSLGENEGTAIIITGDGNCRYYIDKFEGNMTARLNCYKGNDTEFTVPDTFLDCPVTAIDAQAFENLGSLESIHISANVTDIIPQFISDCGALTEITVAEGNTVYTSKGTINGVADTECHVVIHKETATLVAGTPNPIPENITTIGEYAYSRHSGLTQITIPANITTIENYAFEVTGLTELYIPATVTDIGDVGVIYACHNLETVTVAEDNPVYTSIGTVDGVANTPCNVIIEKVTDLETNENDYKLIGGCTDSKIPTEVTIIGDSVFDALSDFDGFSLHEGIKSIGSSAFYECGLITVLNVPVSLTDIGENAFAGCELETIIVAEGNPVYTSRGTVKGKENTECNAIFQTKTVTKTVKDSETGEESTQDVEANVLILGGRYSKIPDNVTVIGASAFQNRGSLYKITLPEQIDTIQQLAFFNCIALRKITILNENCVIESSSIDGGEDSATIYGKADSTAQAYADENGMPFKLYNTDESSIVYFVASNGWESLTGATAAMHYGDGLDNGEATAINSVENDYNLPVYSVKFDEEYESVVFKNGEETVETPEFYGGWYYDSSTDTWYESLEALEEGGEGDEEYTYSEGYYLTGIIGGESITYENEYMLYGYNDEATIYTYYDNIELVSGDSLQVVYYDGEAFTNVYPADGEVYTVSENETGWVTIYFCPDGNAIEAHGWTNNYFKIEQLIARKVGYSLTLSGKIELNFYLWLSDSVINDANAKVEFIVPDFGGANGNYYTRTVDVTSDYCVDAENGIYKFPCEVAAKEMSSYVSAKVVTSTAESEEFITTVRWYAYEIIDGDEYAEEDKALAKALLNYGAAAQKYFNYQDDENRIANSWLSEADQTITGSDFADFAPTKKGEQAGVTYYGSSLLLDSTTSVIHYFLIDESVNADTLTCTVNDVPVELTKNGDLYELVAPATLAQNIGDSAEVKVGGFILNYNAFSFGYLVVNNIGNEALKEVVNALYDYNQAAIAYLENPTV